MSYPQPMDEQQAKELADAIVEKYIKPVMANFYKRADLEMENLAKNSPIVIDEAKLVQIERDLEKRLLEHMQAVENNFLGRVHHLEKLIQGLETAIMLKK